MNNFLYLYLAAVTALVISEYSAYNKMRHLAIKSIASTLFFTYALLSYFSYKSECGLIILLALLLCLTGDVLLGLFDDKNPQYFTYGVLSFLLAHGVFFIAFTKISTTSILDLVLIIAIAGVSYCLTFLKQLDVKEVKKLLVVYSIFLSMLISKGIVIFIENKVANSAIIFTAAILFYLSDIILLFIFFKRKKVRILPFFNIITYYTATILLATAIKF